MRTLALHWSFAIIINAIVLSGAGGFVGYVMAPPIPERLPPPPRHRRPMNCVTGIVILQNDWDRYDAACFIVFITFALALIGFMVGAALSAVIPSLFQLCSLSPLFELLRHLR